MAFLSVYFCSTLVRQKLIGLPQDSEIARGFRGSSQSGGIAFGIPLDQELVQGFGVKVQGHPRLRGTEYNSVPTNRGNCGSSPVLFSADSTMNMPGRRGQRRPHALFCTSAPMSWEK